MSSEHIWNWGDWGRTKNGTIVRFISVWDGGEIFLNGVNGSVVCLRDVEYLPDCTNFDWKPIEPPPGYRILGRKEEVVPGDKYKADCYDEWFEATVFGDTVQKLKAASTVAYARKIIEPPDGYRLLADYEVINAGDKCFACRSLGWQDMVEKSSLIGRQYQPSEITKFARKIEPQYRPFANAAEFAPHRDRWWRYRDDRGRTLTPQNYSAISHGGKSWKDRFEHCEFDNGEPFGVENK